MKHSLSFVAFVLLAAGCQSDPLTPSSGGSALPVVTGIYILNEGNYGDPSGARLTLYDAQNDTVFYDVVEGANGGVHLGSTGDDIKIAGNRLYAVMSGSENISVLNLVDHRLVLTKSLPGWTPHSIVLDTLAGRAYVTRLFSSSVGVLDLTTLGVLDSIQVGTNPQDMVIVGGRLFVCNSGYGSDRTLTVVRTSTRSVEKTILLGEGPSGIDVAGDGSVWVACTGNSMASPPSNGKLFRIDPSSLTVTDSILVASPLAGQLVAGTDGFMYVLGVTTGSYFGGPIHRLNAISKTLTLEFIPGTFYAVAADGASGDIVVSDVKNFVSVGEVRIYRRDGTMKRSFVAERGPGAFAFKR